MQIHQVKRLHKNKHKKLVGRGGKRGTTSGKGTKGQKARSGRKIRPEIRDVIKRIPKLRGRGKNIFQSIQTKPQPINFAALEVFKDGEKVSPKTLMAKSLVRYEGGKLPKVKILAGGELTKKLKFENCQFSDDARAKIEKAGGTIK
ncbi:MAG: uL15 family ribosomal protein [Candidatus Vogelbacteria bacterium]|nr:uL15 family ribosomal protein [Candidatus Vogelbacteria bacterium]